MDKYSLPSKAVVYVMDAYCGWCWGFSDLMSEFEAANRHRIAFTAISGGLFVGDRAASISAYPHIPEANQRISLMTGAQFGEGYQKLLKQGTLVMNSLDAAAGLAALRAQAPERAVLWAHELQAAFYGRGQSLSEPATIAAIAATHGLDEKLVLRQLTDGSAQAQARQDFHWAHAVLKVSSYPTLLLVDGGDVHKLPATGATLLTLNQMLDNLLA